MESSWIVLVFLSTRRDRPRARTKNAPSPSNESTSTRPAKRSHAASGINPAKARAIIEYRARRRREPCRHPASEGHREVHLPEVTFVDHRNRRGAGA